MPSDNPKDSAETLRIMADLERYADMHAPTLSDSADVMDEARHRLAVLQQFANGQGTDARIAALEAQVAEGRKVIEELADVLHSVDENTAADFLDSVESRARKFLEATK